MFFFLKVKKYVVQTILVHVYLKTRGQTVETKIRQLILSD